MASNTKLTAALPQRKQIASGGTPKGLPNQAKLAGVKPPGKGK